MDAFEILLYFRRRETGVNIAMKRRDKFLFFLGFIGVIVLLSSVVTGYYFQLRSDNYKRQTNDLIKSHAFLIRQHSTRLEDLASQLSSIHVSQNGLSANAQGHRALQAFAGQLNEQAKTLQDYAADLIDRVHLQNPEEALIGMEEVNILVPEDLGAIKAKDRQIEELQKKLLRMNSAVRDLQSDLYRCRTSPHPDYYDYEPR